MSATINVGIVDAAFMGRAHSSGCLDGDGDPDLAGTGWDQFHFMHVWRNDAIEHH